MTNHTQPDAPVVQESTTDPHRLANAFCRTEGLAAEGGWALRFYHNEWWEYQDGSYRVVERADLRARVTKRVKTSLDAAHDRTVARDRSDDAEHDVKAKDDDTKAVKPVTRTLVSNVILALESLTLVPARVEMPVWLGKDGPEQRTYLSVENGLLDLGAALAGHADCLGPHNTRWFSPVRVRYAYEPSATCPRWLPFLDQSFEGDAERVAVLQEWFGYNLVVDTTFQKFLVGVGEGGNGKRVVSETLTALLGPDNVSHVPLELFGERFQLTPTLGKLANIASDVGDLDKTAEGMLKAYTSADRMYFDRKGLSGIQAHPTARLSFFGNTVPRFKDRSRGLIRRMIVLPFDLCLAEDQQDRMLTEKIAHELPGILNWAIAGLRRLRQQGGFTDARVCRAVLEAHRLDTNPARAFLLDHLRRTPGGSVVISEVYRHYRQWCDERGHAPLDDRQLGKEVQRVFPGVERVRAPGGRRQKRPWFYRGVQLVDQAPDCQPTSAPMARRRH